VDLIIFVQFLDRELSAYAQQLPKFFPVGVTPPASGETPDPRQAPANPPPLNEPINSQPEDQDKEASASRVLPPEIQQQIQEEQQRTEHRNQLQLLTRGLDYLFTEEGELPDHPGIDPSVPHSPKRTGKLTNDDKILALANALRYFPKRFHAQLGKEFAQELEQYNHIYMYRFRPTEYEMRAYSISDYPSHSQQAAAIMLMIQNNLDRRVAQYPHELITYGGNGAVFQNWAQYHLVMKYLSEMTENQTLAMYSGHPMGLFPSSVNAPRVVITNGMVIPNYSSKADYDKFHALGVTMYGQMTAGSYCCKCSLFNTSISSTEIPIFACLFVCL
jgi:hypothetical protein